MNRGLTVSKAGLVLLAAGASRRLGRPKQLLEYKGDTLINYVLQEIVAARLPAVAVLGANSEKIHPVTKASPVPVVENSHWKEGIASSIVAGLQKLIQLMPGLDGVVFLVCDQPYVSAAFIRQLIEAQIKTGKPIVASSYSGTVGIPALFHQTYFAELLSLKGDAGAKKIIRQHPDDTIMVEFPLGNIDIDTEDDYKQLCND
jgi:molybdenum cofactor cytidylyltransferase